jgi:hypothetical protein
VLLKPVSRDAAAAPQRRIRDGDGTTGVAAVEPLLRFVAIMA